MSPGVLQRVHGVGLDHHRAARVENVVAGDVVVVVERAVEVANRHGGKKQPLIV